MKHRPLSSPSLKSRKERDYTKFRRQIMQSVTLKPPIIVQPDCSRCKRILADHPSYPRTNYPVYGLDCVYPFVDRYP